MKRELAFLLFILFTGQAFTQTWTVGDARDLNVSPLGRSFEPRAQVTFDIDCDGSADLNLWSTGPTGIANPWTRLSLYMEDSVEVYNSNTGYITPFEVGDTVLLGIDSMWTQGLDFIYGTGEMGPYGQESIDNKYIIFRKKDGQTTHYIYILFSNLRVSFTIHQVISRCSINPVEIVTNTVEVPGKNVIELFPNPTQDLISLPRKVKELQIYALNGSLAFQVLGAHRNIDISHLKPGIYLVRVMDGDDTRTVMLAIK